VREALPRALQRWLVRYGRRRVSKEMAEYQQPPEVRFAPFRRRDRSGPTTQVFRSLIQVNFYRAP
jgi:hypothetical protein